MMPKVNFRNIVLYLATVCAVGHCAAQTASIRRSSNLREKPNTSSTIAGPLNGGDGVTLNSPNPTNGYLSVKTADGKPGWVLAKNVSIAGADAGGPFIRSKALAAAITFSPSCTDPEFPSAESTQIDSECGVEGIGTLADQAQNEQKDNFCGIGEPRSITIPDLAALQMDVQKGGDVNFGSVFNSHPLSKLPGPAKDRAPLVALGEGTQVTLTGFVLDAAGEGAEKVNCSLGTKTKQDAALHDIHITIVDNSAANTNKCTGIVAEMIPHHRPDSWTPSVVLQVKASKRQVRVTGNLMFDSDHSPCNSSGPVGTDPSRVSLWEIHPIYKFEVCSTSDCSSGQGFVPLETWKPE